MLTVTLTPEAREVIERDALAAFPNECCGFLYGYEDNTRNITFSQPVENVEDGDQHRRFAISPEQYLDAERFALTQGLTLLGVYHSHPKHPAFPSSTTVCRPCRGSVTSSSTQKLVTPATCTALCSMKHGNSNNNR